MYAAHDAGLDAKQQMWPHQASAEQQAAAEHALRGCRRACERRNLSAHCRPLQQLSRLCIHILYADLLCNDVRSRVVNCLLCAGGKCMLGTPPAASRLPAQLSICMPLLTQIYPGVIGGLQRHTALPTLYAFVQFSSLFVSRTPVKARRASLAHRICGCQQTRCFALWVCALCLCDRTCERCAGVICNVPSELDRLTSGAKHIAQ